MKKIKRLIFVCGVICLVMSAGFLSGFASDVNTVFAAEAGEQPHNAEGFNMEPNGTNAGESASGQEGMEKISLVVDTKNCYAGMKKAYKDGYVPVVTDGKVKLVLPLVPSEKTTLSKITAKLDLGAAEGSPFVYKNYEKEIKRTEEKINDTDKTNDIFLVAFTLNLKKSRINGVYPVVVKTSLWTGGEEQVQEFTVYVSITDGKDATVVEPEPEKPSSEPKLMIEKCIFGREKVLSGESFDSRVFLKNTSSSQAVSNIMVTVMEEAEGLSLAEDSNIFYFDALGAGQTLELPLSWKTEDGIPEGTYSVRLSVTYEGKDAAPFSYEGSFDIQIYQKFRVSFETGELPDSMNAGDSIALPIQVMNLGRGMVYNVRCNVEAKGLSASKSMFIGNLEGGAAGSDELSLFAGMVNPEADSDKERYGRTSGTLVMIYEDSEGTEYREEQEIYMEILPLRVETHSDEEMQEEKTVGAELVISGVVVVLLLLSGLFVPLVWKKVKEHKKINVSENGEEGTSHLEKDEEDEG